MKIQTANINILGEFMNILDIILLLCLIPAMVNGYRKGLITQAISIISLILGVVLSVRFTSAVSTWISQYVNASNQVLNVLAFILILAMVVFGLNLIGRLLEKILKMVMLEWVNRLLGMVIALAKALLIIGLVIMVFSSINDSFNFISPEKLSESFLYNPLKEITEIIFPYLKKLFFTDTPDTI